MHYTESNQAIKEEIQNLLSETDEQRKILEHDGHTEIPNYRRTLLKM
jgi:hypothetical protein